MDDASTIMMASRGPRRDGSLARMEGLSEQALFPRCSFSSIVDGSWAIVSKP